MKSNKSDFNEVLEHNLEGKTSEKDRVSPEKSTLLVVFADMRKKFPSRFEFFSQVSKNNQQCNFLGETRTFSLVLPSKLCSKASLKSLLLDSFFPWSGS